MTLAKLKHQMRKLIFKIKNFFLPTEFNQYYPYSLRPASLATVVLLAVLIKSFAFLSWLSFSELPFFADVTSGLIVYFSNQERQAAGVSPLNENQTLNEAARQKAMDMLAKNYFSHNAPDGTTPWYWFSESGYTYKYAGENLAVDFFESEDVVKAWMSSPAHRFNILNGNYQEIGVAVVKGNLQGKETTLVVQLFGTPRAIISQGPTPTPIPQISNSPLAGITPPILPSMVLSSPTVSPVVAGQGTVTSPSTSQALKPSLSPKVSALALVSPLVSPEVSLAASPSPTIMAGLGTETLPKASLPNPALAEKLINLSVDPSPAMFSLLAYLGMALVLGVFSKIYTPQPKALIGTGLAALLILIINYLPGVEAVFQLSAKVI